MRIIFIEKIKQVLQFLIYTPTELKMIEQQETGKFAKALNYYKVFWVFFIGSFFGVILETIVILTITGTLQSRVGLVYGPFNALYGLGAIVMSFGLYKLRQGNIMLIITLGGFIGAALEYICSYLQEKLIGSTSWNYGNAPFNLHGRTNLLVAVLWGLLGLIWIKALLPRIELFVYKIPNSIGKKITIFLSVFMLINLIVSALAVYYWAQRTNGEIAQNMLAKYFEIHYTEERMKRIFPSMKFK